MRARPGRQVGRQVGRHVRRGATSAADERAHTHDPLEACSHSLDCPQALRSDGCDVSRLHAAAAALGFVFHDNE